MTIFELLKNDHRKVESLLSQIEKTDEDNPEKRSELFSKVKAEFLQHSIPEEVAVYSPLNVKKETHEVVMEAYEEHNLINYLFERVSCVSVRDEVWCAKMTLLTEVIRHHIQDEESEMFAKMRSGLEAYELTQMAHDFRTFKNDDSFLQLHKKSKIYKEELLDTIKERLRKSSQTAGDVIEKLSKRIPGKGGAYIKKVGITIEHMADER